MSTGTTESDNSPNSKSASPIQQLRSAPYRRMFTSPTNGLLVNVLDSGVKPVQKLRTTRRSKPKASSSQETGKLFTYQFEFQGMSPEELSGVINTTHTP